METQTKKLWAALLEVDHYLAYVVPAQINGGTSMFNGHMEPLERALTTFRESKPFISHEIAFATDALFMQLEKNINIFLHTLKEALSSNRNDGAVISAVEARLTFALTTFREGLSPIGAAIFKIETAEAKTNNSTTNYNVSLNQVTGSVNVLSTLSQVTQTVQTGPFSSDDDQKELQSLIASLSLQLASVPSSHFEDAEIVMEKLKSVEQELNRSPEPRKKWIEIEGKGLIDAANALAQVMPSALDIAKKISSLITNSSS